MPISPTSKINDKFANDPVSRQVKYKRRKKAKGECPQCGDVIMPKNCITKTGIVLKRRRLCDKCLAKDAERK